MLALELYHTLSTPNKLFLSALALGSVANEVHVCGGGRGE